MQPARGGISRKRFWIAIHVAFEVTLIAALVWSWSLPGVRVCLLVALASYAVMRLWSAVDFIPKALAFERAEPGAVSETAARTWTARSRWPCRSISSHRVLPWGRWSRRHGWGRNRPTPSDRWRIFRRRRVDETGRGPYFPDSFGITPGAGRGFC